MNFDLQSNKSLFQTSINVRLFMVMTKTFQFIITTCCYSFHNLKSFMIKLGMYKLKH